MFVDFQNYPKLKKDIFEDIKDLNKMGLDIETTGLNPWKNKPILLIFKGVTSKWCLDLRTIPKKDIKKLLEYISTKEIVGHNLKFDYKFLLIHYGVKFDFLYCTYITARILWTGVNKDFSLKGLLKEFFNVEMNKETRNSFINKPESEPFYPHEIEYAENDVEYLIPLQEKLDEFVIKYDMEFLRNLENKFLSIITKVELHGIKLDENAWRRNIKKWEKDRLDQIFALDKELLNLSEKYPDLRNANFDIKLDSERNKVIQKNLFFEDTIVDIEKKGRINWASQKQIGQILFLCNTPVENTKEETLLEYNKKHSDHDLHRLFFLLVGDGDKINGLRQIEKLISTYGENFFSFINPITGKIHTNFGQVNTETGRLNSGDIKSDNKPLKIGVNMQNIPADNEIRNCFVADEGYLFASCDLSGCELRVAASDSQEPVLVKGFSEGLDFHSLLAQVSFRIIKNDPDFIVTNKVNKDLRNLHKRVLFG